MDIYEHYKKIGLSNLDLLKFVNGNAKIVLYNEMYKYKTLDQLLYPYDVVFILYESKPRWGHWTLLFKRDEKNVEFFDSYSTIIDDGLDYIDEFFRKKSNQDYPYLTRLLYNSPYNIHYNQYKYQDEEDKNDNTCGRWVLARWLYRDLTLKQFSKLFQNKNGTKMVIDLTYWLHHDD